MKLSSLVTFGAFINTAIHTVNSASSVTTYRIETKCNSILSTCPAVTNNVEEVKKCLSDVKNLVRGGDASCFGVITVNLEFLNQTPLKSTDPNNKDVLYALNIPKDQRLYINDPDIDEQLPFVNLSTTFLATAQLSGFQVLPVQVGKPDPQHFFTKDPAPVQLSARFSAFHEPFVWGVKLDNREPSIRYISPDDIVLGVVVPPEAWEVEMEAFNSTATLLYMTPIPMPTRPPTVI